MNKNNAKFTLGFTVIELLVVIAVIGLLASIVLVSLNLPERRRQARLAKSLEFSQSMLNVLGVDLVGWWGFESVSEGKTPDKSGYGNEGTVSGATPADGMRVGQVGTGQALSFDEDSSVDCGSDSRLDPTSELTIEAWVYRKSNSKKYKTIVGDEDYAENKGYYFGDYWTVPLEGNIGFRINGRNGGRAGTRITERSKSLNQWVHYAAVFNGTSLNIYKNGALDNSKTFSLTTISSDDGATTIGNSFNGLIDEVRIYHTALSAFEIQQHYTEGLERHKNLATK